MTTTTQPAVAAAIQSSMVLVKMYGEAVTKDIDPAKAACKPGGIDCNHPVWNFGHLSIYFDNALKMLGKPELASPKEGYEELFSDKSVCQDDPEGKVYPLFDEVKAYYFERLDMVSKALDDVGEDVLSSPNRATFTDVFQTIGEAVNFLMIGHNFMHHGQTSTWRRAMGLGHCI